MSFKLAGACRLDLLRFLTLYHPAHMGGILLTDSSRGLGFNRYFCSAVVACSFFFNLPLADVFLSVPRSNLPALPSAVTGPWTHGGDVPLLCQICTGFVKPQFPQHKADVGQGALHPMASGGGRTGFPGAGARETGWEHTLCRALAIQFPSPSTPQPLKHHQGC